MKRIVLIVVLLGMISWAGVSRAEARDFGLGVIFGEPPVGLSLKLWPGRFMAMDAAFAWRSHGGESYFRFHVDILFQSNLHFGPPGGRLAFYYGLGGRYLQDGERGGLRVPLGLSYYFGGVPIELFIEFVPTLDLTPNTDFEPALAGGIRIYLF